MARIGGYPGSPSKTGGGTLKKKKNRSTAKDFAGQRATGSIRTSPAKKGGSLGKKKPKVSKKAGDPSDLTTTIDVYGSGSSGGSGGSSGYSSSGGGGYSSSGYGGYSSGGGGSSAQSDYYKEQQEMAEKQFQFQKDQFQWEKNEAKRQRQIEEQQRKAGRMGAKTNYQAKLDMIQSAIDNAQSRFRQDREDIQQRGQQAIGDTNRIYGQNIDFTENVGQAASEGIAQHGQAADQSAQSLVDALATRNQQTTQGLQGNMEAMGLGRGMQETTGGVSEALALSEMQARGNQASTAANYGLQQGAQEAITGWDLSGLKSDRAETRTDINRQTESQISELHKVLKGLVGEQQIERLRARGEMEGRVQELTYDR